MSKKFSQEAKVWIYPGVAGWHFINIDKKPSEEIKKIGRPSGVRFTRIRATLGKTTWETALFPQKMTGTFLLAIKAKVRKEEGVLVGDMIKVSFEII